MSIELQYILLGCFGGIVPDLLRFITNKKSLLESNPENTPDPNQPNKSSNRIILMGLLAQIILGGLAVIIILDTIKDYKTAVFTGFFGAEIITALAAIFKKDNVPKAPEDREPLGADDVAPRKKTFKEKFNYLLSWWHM